MPTCNDGCCLTSHLVLVNVFAIVQFPFDQNPGAKGQKSKYNFEIFVSTAHILLDILCVVHTLF